LGNSGFIEYGDEVVTFGAGPLPFGSEGQLWRGSGFDDGWNRRYEQVGGYRIVPLGVMNDLPDLLRDTLDSFYAGEGIIGKKIGLMWGDGPMLYRLDYSIGEPVRCWVEDSEIEGWLKSWDYMRYLHCRLVDLQHINFCFSKLYRNRGYRIGASPKVAKLSHVSVSKCRLEYPPEDLDFPERVIVGDFPYVDLSRMAVYPLFDRNDPWRHAVSMSYSSVYSFCKDYISTPGYYGALPWIRLANTLAPLLANYNKNAAAIKYHIESPQEYWTEAEDRLKARCQSEGRPYTRDVLDKFQDEVFSAFGSNLTGLRNPGKFFHTKTFWDDEARNFAGWKVHVLKQEVKEYIDAQIIIANKADSAATSGFGLHPSLSNIMVDGKLSSGSEQLYAGKFFISAETAIPEWVLFNDLNTAIELNWPDKKLRIGFFRKIVMKESDVSSGDRVSNNV
jgi:hypothetical protein